MALAPDPDRQVKTHTCHCCRGERQVATGFVYRDGEPHAVYYAACYPHQTEAEGANGA